MTFAGVATALGAGQPPCSRPCSPRTSPPAGPGRAGTALVVLLLALSAWNAAYAGELLAGRPGAQLRWGDAKYLGICTLTPAWVSFILLYTGRGRLVTRRLLLALSVEPLLLLAAARRAADPRPRPVRRRRARRAGAGRAAVLGAPRLHAGAAACPRPALFVVALVRLSRAYWLQASALTVAALLPWVANLLFNLEVGAVRAASTSPRWPSPARAPCSPGAWCTSACCACGRSRAACSSSG